MRGAIISVTCAIVFFDNKDSGFILKETASVDTRRKPRGGRSKLFASVTVRKGKKMQRERRHGKMINCAIRCS